MKRKFINIDSLMTQKEKRYYTDNMSISEKPLITKHIIHDNSYSYEWTKNKKNILSMIQ